MEADELVIASTTQSMQALGSSGSPVAANFVATMAHFGGNEAPGTIEVELLGAPLVRRGSTVEAEYMYSTHGHDGRVDEYVIIVDSNVDAHGWLMYLAWGVLIPAGIVVARFGKARPDAWWFKTHRASQTVGLVVALVGMVIGIVSVDGHRGKHFRAIEGMGGLAAKHYPLALATMVLGVLQPLNAIMRPPARATGAADAASEKTGGEKGGDRSRHGSTAEKSFARIGWEYWHKGSGYLAVVLAWLTIQSGIELHKTEISKKLFILHLHPRRTD